MFRLRLFHLFCLILLTVCPAFGNPCPVVRVRPATPGDTALRSWHLVAAEKLYTAEIEKDPSADATFSGLILSQLYLGDTDAALATALDAIKLFPGSATLVSNLAEIQFRRADLSTSRATLQRALALDPCNPRAFYATAKYLQASSMNASARDRLNSAHRLSPDDPEITDAWLENQPIAARMAVWKKRLQSDDLPAKEKLSLSSELEKLETLNKAQSERGKCKVISTAASMTLPFSYIMEDAVTVRHLGLDVRINNKATARLQIDTGASGIILGRGLAAKAGLRPLTRTKFYGIGDDGVQTSYSAIADDLKIGQFEFKNCLVEVSNKRSIADEDGLIGGDVFKDYLLTIDFPDHSIKVDPLPQRPVELGDADLAPGKDADVPPVMDAYVAPAMKDWTPVLRFDHQLMVPVGLGDSKVHWFLLDTGAYTTILSPAAAAAVTQVSRNRDTGVVGLSGEVKEVFEAKKVEITFAGIRHKLNDAVVFNLDHVTGTEGVDASGLLGFGTLQFLVMQIDYRDGLVHFDYDPKHGANRFSAR